MVLVSRKKQQQKFIYNKITMSKIVKIQVNDLVVRGFCTCALDVILLC